MNRFFKAALFLLMATASLNIAATEVEPPANAEAGCTDPKEDAQNPEGAAEEGEFNAMHCGGHGGWGGGRGGWGGGGWGGWGGGCGGGGGWGWGGHHRRHW